MQILVRLETKSIDFATPSRYDAFRHSSRRSEGPGPAKITNRPRVGGNARCDEENHEQRLGAT